MVWLWVAWAFHWQRFASINWAATWFAAAFALQGLGLGLAALGPAGRDTPPPRRAQQLGLALLLFALVLHPALGLLLGRPWQQAEVFGMAPDPTVLGTLGVLLFLPPRAASGSGAAFKPAAAWWLWPLPLLWSAVSGIMLATMQAADALVLPAAALVALAAQRRKHVN